MQTPPPTWADLAWLREQRDGPFMVKGGMRPEDAARAQSAALELAQLEDELRHLPGLLDVAAEEDHAAEIELPRERLQLRRNDAAVETRNQQAPDMTTEFVHGSRFVPKAPSL